MSKAKELLEKIDIEIEEKVAEKVEANATAIVAYAQSKYDEAYAEKVDEIKNEVSKDYEKAKNYLLEVVAAEEPAETVEAEPVLENASDPNVVATEVL